MTPFDRGAQPAPSPEGSNSVTPEDLVRSFLRGQNLEQVQRPDEAIEHYERAVAAGFDACGPYDRLIYLYLEREDHTHVRRIARAALTHVKTYDDKRSWYERMEAGANTALRERPDPSGPEF